MPGNLFWKSSGASTSGKKRPSSETLDSLPKQQRRIESYFQPKYPTVFGVSSSAPRSMLSGGSQQVPKPPSTYRQLVCHATQPLQDQTALLARTSDNLNGINRNNGKQLEIKERDSNNLRRPISELPQRFRTIFPYVSFNHVQSLVFDTIMDTNKPVMVSAPTGAGKTGVFELAIIKTMIETEKNSSMSAAKIVYLAPTKALCSERCKDWETKFSPFNMQCFELTSDMTNSINFKNLHRPSILLATPEKWDSITRSWNGQKAFVQAIRLLLIDEVHLVNDGARGATLEAVISRMKTIRAMIWPSEQDNLRFVGVSATVSNIKDIGSWFSTPSSQAELYEVDPKERPVKLRTVVLGYNTNVHVNEFSFDTMLNHKLAEVIKDYSNDKPTLIFCATRKFAMGSAKALVKEGKFDMCFSNEKRKLYLQISSQIRDKTLQETTRMGVAFHHAGLCSTDRKLIESGFTDGSVMILCCTSTLALGVNLPAHLVIVKNTSYFDEGQFKPYSESSIVQMIGRAGRPQFDTEATAVIMTKSFCKDEIQKMLTGRLVVDSKLHKYLTEHLNSEIVLGTITDDSIARKWIDSTFLHVRLMINPENYGLPKGSSNTAKEHTIIQWCKTSIEQLIKYKMAKRTNQGQLESTDAGRAMARHYICLDTMVKLIQLEGSESMWDLIKMICSSTEVSSDMQLRQEDKTTLNALTNPDEERKKLRFTTIDKNYTRELKAAILIQATFGNITISENTIFQESNRVLRNATRVMNCLKEISLLNSNIGYKLLLNVLTLSQCFVARLWEDSIYVSKQMEKIGNILSFNLANNGLTTFDSLRKANPRNIELFCNRLPPFGSTIQQTAFGLPIYELKIYFRAVPMHSEKVQLMADITILNGQDMRTIQTVPRSHSSMLIVGNAKNNKVLLTQPFTDSTLLQRPDLTVCFGAEIDKIDLPDNHENIEGHIISDLFVGLDAHTTTKYVEPETNGAR